MKYDKEITLVCAFRYALGRKTYVTHAVSNEIIKNWSKITSKTRDKIKNTIKISIDNHKAGSVEDINNWERILKLK